MFMHRDEFMSRARDAVGPICEKRSIPNGFQRGVELKRPAIESPQPRPDSPVESKKKTRKPPNYLRHGDRCIIIKRIAGGEQQAALAREFGVTRAAVCQMYKNRDEILSREDEPEPRPPTTVPQTALVQGTRSETFAHEDSGITTGSQLSTHEPSSKTAMLLLTVLKDERTDPVAFRRAAARLTFILVEEALANYDGREIIRVAATGCAYSGAEFCAITLGDQSASFLAAIEQIDPKIMTGQIHVQAEYEDGYTSWNLRYLDVPDNITDFEVLLFSTSANGGAECKGIEALRRIGVLENRISLVMVVCSSHGYKEVCGQYPRVKIISAAIDDDWTLQHGLYPQDVVPRPCALVPNGPNHC